MLAEVLLCCMIDHAGAIGQIKRVLKKDGRVYLRITRFLRKSDPNTVTKDEWQRILGNFTPLKSWQGFFSRWAVVSKSDAELPITQLGSSSSAPNPLDCVCN